MTRPLLRLALTLLLLAGCGPVGAAPPLRVCMSDVAHQPWRVADDDGRVRGRGLDFELLQQFRQRSGRELQLMLHAGRRCLVELELGRADIGIGLSHTAERARYLRYPPLRQGEPDASLALRVDHYYLYQRAEGGWRWQGGRLQGSGVIGAQPGSSVAGWLRDKGLAPQEQDRLALQLMHKLVEGQLSGAALLGGEAEALRAQNPQLATLQRLLPALLRRHYFAVFSEHYAAAHEEELAGLWRHFAEAAQMPAYQRAARGAAQGD